MLLHAQLCHPFELSHLRPQTANEIEVIHRGLQMQTSGIPWQGGDDRQLSSDWNPEGALT
jgi:hypothetical protein